ncbi:alpha/beta hydrolase [Kitasatospora sp. NPDC093558]|uniref:alpha/beta hydrolase n=1 Tax=Kitasatospora sp. NPDC093558 TaxID=3155201 RepID=UPI00342B1314
MNIDRAARPRVLLTALAAGTLLLASACNDTATPAQDKAAAGTPAPAATATATPTPKPTGADDPALKTFYAQQISWAPCPPDAKAEQAKANIAAMQCGTLHVPLDYANPAKDALDLALVKYPATKPDQRIGSLLVNPGGPGASGVEMVKYGAKDFAGALHSRFDVIGFDPRGTGASSPVTCLDDKQRDADAQVDDPLDPAARKAQSDQQNARFIAACQAKSGKLLPFVGTRNSARDMDVLRAAVGDKKLNYLGVSYGTYLGSLYAEEFPKNVGRLVLDGAVDPAADGLDSVVKQTTGFEKSFERFAADCVDNHATECPLGKDPGQAAQKASDFLDSLRDHPLPTKDGRKVNAGLGWTGLRGALYGDENSSWQYLRVALSAAMKDGKGDVLLALADDYDGRDENGHYSPMDEAHAAISCADGSTPAPTAERAQQIVKQLHDQAPLLAKDIDVQDFTESSCNGWPFQSPEKPHTIRAEGADPILVVGSTGDPATPYAAAEALAKGFANATLLTRVGEGHAAFGKNNACIDQALETYLTAGTMPAAGTRCT